MSITSKLNDKLEREIREFCKMNGLQLGEYTASCIEKQFNLDRYGDLNELIHPSVPANKDTRRIEQSVCETKDEDNTSVVNATPEKEEVSSGTVFEGGDTLKTTRIRTLESR